MNLAHVANYVDLFAARNGLDRGWQGARSRDTDEQTIHARVRECIGGAADAAHWSNLAFQNLVRWAVDAGVMTVDEIQAVRVQHGLERGGVRP
jgi:hypothetical protein